MQARAGDDYLRLRNQEQQCSSYQEALAYLYAFSGQSRSAAQIRGDWPRKLPRMRALLAGLGNPERAFQSVLVAGTKGKGSVAAMLESIGRAAGHPTGLYTQPHLQSWCERTRLGERFIRPDEVAALIAPVREAVDRLARERPELGSPTTFEVGTALTLLAFAEQGVRLAIVEVGVGGAHDATNVVDPLLVVLGPISLDHTATLGSTLAEIATEKAGLFRPGGLAIVGAQPPEAFAVIERIAQERGTRLELLARDWRWRPIDDRPACGRFAVEGPSLRLEGLATPLLGRHQRDNATLAIAAACALAEHGFPISPAAIREGLAGVVWSGRLQVLGERPRLVIDGAHNGDSAAHLARALKECFEWRRLHLVLGMSEGKDVAGVLDALLPLADRLILTQSHHERAAALDALAAAARARDTDPDVEDDVTAALRRALADAAADDLICVTGSLFLVGEAIEAVGAEGWGLGVGE